MIYEYNEISNFSKIVIKGIKYKCGIARKKLLDICIDNKKGYECLSPKYMEGNKVEVLDIEGNKIYTVIPKNLKSNKHIIFYHGGAYVLRGTKYHWKFIEKLLKKLKCKITFVDYPVADLKIGHVEIYNMALDGYKKINEIYSEDDFIFMGDSAGGGLALGLTQRLRGLKKTKSPQNLILLSPWLDLSMENSMINDFKDKDLVLSIEGLDAAANLFVKNLDKKSRLISPIYSDMKGLCPIITFVGTREVMNPDCILLDKICTESGVEIKTYIYKDMIHDWCITPVKEADDVIEKLSKEIFEK